MTNPIHDAFSAVKADAELKASTLSYLNRRRNAQRARVNWNRPRSLAAVFAALVLMVGISGYSLAAPVSYVSIDVNPSVELALNRFDRVVSATAYNEDGEIVLEGVSVRGMGVVAAVDAIVESEAMRRYLKPGSELTFTVAADDEKKTVELRTEIENSHACREHRGQSAHASVEAVSEAHDNGMSLGKYAAYLTLAEYDASVTAEDCQDMTMSEIHDLIREHDGSCGDGCDGGNATEQEHGGQNERHQHGGGHG